MSNRIGSKRIGSLHAVRGIAFLAVFVYHAIRSFPGESALYHFVARAPGPWAVSVFFVLSGFVMTYAYWDREPEKSLGSCARFAWKKIKRLYPLHLIMLVFGTIRLIYKHKKRRVIIIKLIKTIPLMQTWFPKGFEAINTVAWYLSVCLFLYFVFPYLLPWIKRSRTNTALIKIAAVYLLQFAVAFLANEYLDFKIQWIAYCHPVYRLGDFAIGGLLSAIYKGQDERSEVNLSVGFATILELAAVALNLVVCVLFAILPTSFLWFRYTCLFLPATGLLVYAFSFDSGVLSKLIKNKVTFWLADISPYVFMIHRIVIYYFRDITRYLGFEDVNVILKLLIPFAVSVIAAYIYLAFWKPKSSRSEGKK